MKPFDSVSEATAWWRENMPVRTWKANQEHALASVLIDFGEGFGVMRRTIFWSSFASQGGRLHAVSAGYVLGFPRTEVAR